MGMGLRVLRGLVIAALVALAGLSSAALAQDGPTAVRANASNGTFVWIDGSWRLIHLPTYGLGLHNVGPGSTDAGLVQSYNPRPDGAGISGGIGFTLPNGAFGNAFGSNARIAIAGSYLRATSSQSEATASFDSVVQLVDGTVIVRCNLPVACPISSRLDSDHRAWRTEISVAGDVRKGSVTLTPSLAVLGGASRTDQTFSQQRDTTSYSASSEMKWTDWGAKFGLAATLPVTSGFDLRLGGNIGVVHRDASLSANDSGNNGGAVTPAVLNISASTAALLAGTTLELIAHPTETMTVRLFGGLDYDSRVPGIASPTFVPANLVTTIGTPAGINFSGETNYFAGAGLSVRFGR